MEKNIELVNKLADYFVKTNNFDEQRWGWGEGLIAYALMLLDKFNNSNKYFDYVKSYIDYHYQIGPNMDCSDRIAPTLAANELYKITKDDKYLELVDKALDYILNCKKVYHDIPNHFGTSKKEESYPTSIWVDSLMMFSYFPSVIGYERNDTFWKNYAIRQPIEFDQVLRSKDGPWYHSYWTDLKTHYPINKLYWGRGNGWAMITIPMIVANNLDCFQANEVKKIYKKLVDGVIKYQCKDGMFRTLLNRIESYKETSATALIAAGIYKAINIGLLDNSYKAYASKAYEACIRNIKVIDDKVLFTKISGSTVPLEKFPGPYYWYMSRKKKVNANYGVASIILATIFKYEGE